MIVVRNGAAVTVNVGDALNKTDIVQTSSDSTVGISLLDGTVMNLSANTRMALNEFLYDVSAASGNGGHFSLIQGAFAFVSGLVAKTGGLNIETSVAVIGIRGTVGGAACADAGHCEYYAAPEISGPNAGQPSTFALLTGGRFVNGQYVGGTSVGTVTVGANAQVAATGVNTPPQVTFVAAANADPALSALTQQLIQFYPQVTTPTQAPTQAPQGPPGPSGPPGINPQSAPSSPGGSSSPPPPPDPSPLLKNDNPNDLHPLASIPAPTEVVVVVPTITPAGQTDVVVTVAIAPVTSAVTLANGPSISSVSSTSGPVVNGGSTNDPNPMIAVSVSGTDAVAGNTVQLFNGTAPLGNAHTLTTSEVTSGIANVHTGLLSDGTYHITAGVTDTSGNPSFSAPFVVIEDTTPPTAPTIVVTDNVNPVTGSLA
ncbi:MAG: FecR domain-containing protein, partial [Pseudolabrys sp.]